MTTWTKVGDQTTEYLVGDDNNLLLSQEREPILQQNGDFICLQGIETDYTEVVDSSDRYIPFGVGLKVATEAFNWILTEGRQTLLVHSRTNWTETDDVNTTYTKVEDA